MNIAEIEDRIRRSELAYYDELRKQMGLYQAVNEAFPAFLKGNKRIIAVLGRNGVVSHWAAEKDSFEFRVSNKTLGEIANEYSGGGMSFEFPPGSDVGLKVAQAELHEGTDMSGPLVWRSPWDQIELSSRINAIRWNENLARSEARNDVLTYVTGHLLELDQAKPPAIFRKLESVISKFDSLLKSDPREEEVQRYLTGNPVLLTQMLSPLNRKLSLGLNM